MATRTDLSSMSSKPKASGGKSSGKGKGGGEGAFAMTPRTMALGGLVVVMAIIVAWMNWPASSPAPEVPADGLTPTTPGAPGVPPGEPAVIPSPPPEPGTEGFSPS